MALLWAAGILWFAYDFAGSTEQQSTGDVNSSGANEVSELLTN